MAYEEITILTEAFAKGSNLGPDRKTHIETLKSIMKDRPLEKMFFLLIYISRIVDGSDLEIIQNNSPITNYLKTKSQLNGLL